MITDIQHFSVHDGPGIRTTVFLKGCNLRCFWCHNPETLTPRPELQYFEDRCIACGNCVPVCPESAHSMIDGVHRLDRNRCTNCGACPDVCYPRALTMAGMEKTSSEVVEAVLRDQAYYDSSGGGLTVSGGEPLLQPEFTREILEGCRRAGVHTAVETAAAVPWARLELILPVTQLVMMDIKSLDTATHSRVTGVPNKRILENAERLAASGMPLIIRTPVIPGVNDNEASILAIAEFTARLDSLLSYELLMFHPMATSKYSSLGLRYEAAELVSPSEETMQRLRLAAANVEVRTAGA